MWLVCVHYFNIYQLLSYCRIVACFCFGTMIQQPIVKWDAWISAMFAVRCSLYALSNAHKTYCWQLKRNGMTIGWLTWALWAFGLVYLVLYHRLNEAIRVSFCSRIARRKTDKISSQCSVHVTFTTYYILY